MLVTINAKEYDIPKDATISDILKMLGVEEKTMAVAVNMQIVKKDKWQEFRPKEGDKIEILGFTGGG